METKTQISMMNAVQSKKTGENMYEYDLYYDGEHLCSDEFHTEREVIVDANDDQKLHVF